MGLCCDRCDKIDGSMPAVAVSIPRQLTAQGDSSDWFCPACIAADFLFTSTMSVTHGT